MSRRVLVVDDDAAIRATFELLLSRLECEVMVAESAEAALAKIGSFAPNLVITDVRMSGMTGLDLLATLKEHAPDLDVLVITAFDDLQSAINAMKAGAYDYLIKPLDLERIEQIVERCLRDGSARRRISPIRAADEGAEVGLTLNAPVGHDPRMLEIYKTIGTLARSRAAVLVRGETGTGKEVVARAIHDNSPHASEPFVAVNCTALPEDLLESELFGHMRGSFTGAVADRKGCFELAGRGTIFLDEIGDTSPALQAKLLRVLQEREFRPIGGERPRRTEARVIAATHRPIETLVRDGRFREDLYYRLRVIEIVLPPLRDRRTDIAPLAEHFVVRASAEHGREIRAITADAVRALESYDWPGNVRELENTITRAVVLARGKTLTASDVSIGREASDAVDPSLIDGGAPGNERLDTVERAQIARVLARTGGNKMRAARVLGVSRPRLDRLIAKHRLEQETRKE